MSADERTNDSARRSISSLSTTSMNPYLGLLYRALARVGVPTGPLASLQFRWLFAHRRSVRYLHAHWPEGLYRLQRGPASWRSTLSWLKLGMFAVRLRMAAFLGYRIVWTIHQVYPHDYGSRLDRAGSRLLARRADLLLAHDPETAGRAHSEIAPPSKPIEVVAHGSYVDVYPPGRSRMDVRRELGIPDEAVMFLRFGELRANSDVFTLLEAFKAARIDASALVVAGNAKDPRAAAAVAAASASDARIVRIDGFVPFGGVRELYEAADVAVVPRADGGTSGSLILALSLARPVVVADMPAYRRLVGDGRAGWTFRSGDAADLGVALEAAAADRGSRARRGSAAQEIAVTLDWDSAARQIASFLPE